MYNDFFDTFLSLVRLGIGASKFATIPKDVNWNKLKALADEQGLSAIILNALNSVGMNQTEALPIEMKLEWIGEVLQNFEGRYAQYTNAISSLAGFYNQHGLNMMVLKGYACSLDWSRPEHRPCGDIDVWLFGHQKEADNVLCQEGIKIDSSHHHHTVFNWHGFTVENHYDFVNIHHHKSNIEIEKIFKELASDDSHSIDVLGERVYVPSPNLHALFLLRHAMNHFSSSEITLRQLMDWAFFVKAHGDKVNWDWLLNELEYFGMVKLFNVFNAICVHDLGFASSSFPFIQCDQQLKERVLNDILSPEYHGEEPQEFLSRIVFKYKRWRANSWKHQLCFKDSIWSAFLSGVWSHLLKPSSI